MKMDGRSCKSGAFRASWIVPFRNRIDSIHRLVQLLFISIAVGLDPAKNSIVIGQPWLCSKAQFGVEAEPVATMGAKAAIPVWLLDRVLLLSRQQ